jgi:DNA-binding winged helix-turn-helix (wHTH) protein/Tol biopolymer transport system component
VGQNWNYTAGCPHMAEAWEKMLKSHSNLLAARPSERLRIGDYIVDLSLREITRADGGGEAVRITLKAQGVLMVLVANAGKVVSREALLEWVWPDTMPGDDVVTQAIAQLRRAFGDSRSRTVYIDTISKHGYRLTMPVEWCLVDADRAASPPRVEAMVNSVALSKPVRSSFAVRAAMLAAVVLAAALGIVWLSRSAPDVSLRLGPAPLASQELPIAYQRIASSPAREYAPSLSPDGSLVVYVRYSADDSGSALFQQVVTGYQPKALTAPAPGRWDGMPAWSPDGRSIVFLRKTEAGCAVMLMPAIGGSEREIGRCLSDAAHHIGWYPDSATLIAAGPILDDAGRPSGSALYRMALQSGVWKAIPYARAAGDVDGSAAVSPDGRWIAFHRNAALGDVWRIPVAGGEAQRLSDLRENVFGLAWLPDSRGLIVSRYRAATKVLSRIDTESGKATELAIDGPNFEYPSVASVSGALVFQIEETRAGIFHLPLLAGRSAHERLQPLYETSRSNRLPSLSPDGSQLVFVSDRSGRLLLWWVDRDQPESLRPIKGFAPSTRFPPVWDSSSQRLYAIGEGAQGPGAYEIKPGGGQVVRLPIPEGEPTYVVGHPDPSRILIVANRGDGRLALVLYDRNARPWRELARIEDNIGVPIVDRANARILYVLRPSGDIIATDLQLRNPQPVDHQQRRGRGHLKTFNAASDGVWFLEGRSDCAWYWRRVASQGASIGTPSAPAGVCLGDPGGLDLEGVSYDPVRRALYLSTLAYPTQDIGFLDASAVQ